MNAKDFIQERKVDISAALFVISMGIMLNPIIGGTHLPDRLEDIIALIWIAAGLFLAAKGTLYGNQTDCSFLVKVFFTPKFLIWLYSMTLFMTGIADMRHFSSGFTQMISVLLPLCALFLFRGKTIDYVFWGCALSFASVVIYTVITYGISSIAAPFLSMINTHTDNPFENHEFTFTVSYLLIYYSCLKEERGSRDVLHIVVSFIMVLFGYKRILVLAILAVILFSFIYDRCNVVIQKTLCGLSKWGLLILCSFFLFSLYSDYFFELVSDFDIDTMGRVYYYQAIVDETTFSPTFLGLGLNVVSKLLASTYSYMNVGGVHSDILKYYAEIGFIGFCLWIWFYLFKLPKLIERQFGGNAVYGLYLINVFTFIVFLTDNIDIYLGPQLLYVAIPFTFAMQKKSQDCILIRQHCEDGEQLSTCLVGQQSVQSSMVGLSKMGSPKVFRQNPH